jgi:hypothetical protein
MRVSIIPVDGVVVLNGVAKDKLDLSFMSDVHAVQWYDTWGEVERYDGIAKLPNERIESIAPYQAAIDAWNAAPSGE